MGTCILNILPDQELGPAVTNSKLCKSLGSGSKPFGKFVHVASARGDVKFALRAPSAGYDRATYGNSKGVTTPNVASNVQVYRGDIVTSN
jgi:hypothetical protein